LRGLLIRGGLAFLELGLMPFCEIEQAYR